MEQVPFVGLRGQAIDATIFNQAGQSLFQGPVSIRFFGVAVGFSARGDCLGRGAINVTAITDLAVCVASVLFYKLLAICFVL